MTDDAAKCNFVSNFFANHVSIYEFEEAHFYIINQKLYKIFRRPK